MKALTKGQYEGIAYALDRTITRTGEQTETYMDICEALADEFGASDPEFKRELFLSQCGVTE
jgi:uncharacterized protein YutE (UPF0331/DUF86 family)